MRSRSWPAVFAALGLGLLPLGSAHAQWVQNGTGYGMASNDQLQPAICPDGVGGAFLVWSDSRIGPYQFDVYIQRVNSVGIPQWTANGVAVCTAPGDQILPAVVSDGAGGAIIAWEDYRNGNQDIFAQRVDSMGTVVWPDTGVALCTQFDTQTSHVLVPDGTGGAIAFWEDYRAFESDIYAQRVNSAGVVRWTVNGRGICTVDSDQLTPQAVRSGTATIVTWLDDRNFEFDVFAQRIDSTGASLWSASGVAVCDVPGDQNVPVIDADGAGGAVIAWEDFRDAIFTFDIYAQRLSQNGSRLWTAGGVSLVFELNDQYQPAICNDGSGGAIVAWQDTRAVLPDIYARRINAGGVPQWAANGVAVTSANGTQQTPRILSDGLGGAIVAWEDLRASTFNVDLYAQRLDPNGTPLWAANGLALTNAGTDQVRVQLTTDGAHGIIAAWEDGRAASSSDIYAQRVNAAGIPAPTTDVPRRPVRDFALVGIQPNPCRTSTSLRFALPAPQAVTAEVFDLGGRRVRALASRAAMPAGLQSIAWDARDESGARVDAGLYWVRVTTASGSATGKVTVVR